MAMLMTAHKQTGEPVELGITSRMGGLRMAVERVAQFRRPAWVNDTDGCAWATVTLSAGEIVVSIDGARGQTYVATLGGGRWGVTLRRIG